MTVGAYCLFKLRTYNVKPSNVKLDGKDTRVLHFKQSNVVSLGG